MLTINYWVYVEKYKKVKISLSASTQKKFVNISVNIITLPLDSLCIHVA